MKQTNKKLTADNALALSMALSNNSKVLGKYYRENWAKISVSKRKRLMSQEITLLNHAQNLITDAVGIVLDQGQGNLKVLIDTTKEAKKALEKIKSTKKAINIAAALILLAAAIPTNNPGSIYTALRGVKDSI